MKKVVLPIFVFAAATSSLMAGSISNGSTNKTDAGVIQTDPTGWFLWKAGGSNGTPVADPDSPTGYKNTDYYVKINAGETVAYTYLYGSGSGGQYNNANILFGQGSVMELNNNGNISDFNSNSTFGAMYRFLLDDTGETSATSATVNLTSTNNSIFNLSYDPSNSPTITERGVEIGEGITVNASGDLQVNNNAPTVSVEPIFKVDGNINVLNDEKTFSFSNAPITQGATSTITAANMSFLNSTASLGGNIVSDSISLNNSKVTFGSANSVKAKTEGARPKIELGGNNITLNATDALATANANITTKEKTSSRLTIASSMTVNSYKPLASGSTLTVNKGVTFTVGNNSENELFDNRGNSGTIYGTLLINAKGYSHGHTSYVGNLTIDGGTIKDVNSNASSYSLSASGSTVKLFNSATADAGISYLGVNNSGTYTVDSTSKIVAAGLSFASGGTLNLSSASSLNGQKKEVLLKDGKAVMNLNYVATTAEENQGDFTIGTDVYDFGTIALVRTSNMDLHLNGAEVHFNGIKLVNASAEKSPIKSSIVFYDFANGSVKLGLLGDSVIHDDGKIDIIVSDTTRCTNTWDSIIISAFDKEGNELKNGWSIDQNGYLFNSALVPEPAEWAAIFGALALAIAMYRRRK